MNHVLDGRISPSMPPFVSRSKPNAGLFFDKVPKDCAVKLKANHDRPNWALLTRCLINTVLGRSRPASECHSQLPTRATLGISCAGLPLAASAAKRPLQRYQHRTSTATSRLNQAEIFIYRNPKCLCLPTSTSFPRHRSHLSSVDSHDHSFYSRPNGALQDVNEEA
jgi:hypothetical protein